MGNKVLIEKQAENKERTKFHSEHILPLIKQLLKDVKSAPERVNISLSAEGVSVKDIQQYCEGEGDMEAYSKMLEHELVHEPAERVVVFGKKNGEKIPGKYFNQILVDLGYNVDVLFSKNHGSDYEAATNIGGYSIPGWEYFVKFLRKINSNLAVFFGKRFAPGSSRLHLRIYEGNKNWYVIAHIDEFNWINPNILGVMKSHKGSGGGNYKDGTEIFLESAKYYINDSDDIRA